MKLLPFGCLVVPTVEQLIKIDEKNLALIEELRPARRNTNLRTHIAFHDAVTRALAFRLMLRFALRVATILPLLASIFEQLDCTVDLPEKSSRGRRGGLPAIITRAAKAELHSYRLHCTALRRKLSSLYFRGTAMQWLTDVINHRNVPLLALIQEHGVPNYLGTHMVLTETNKTARVANDFGRKWTENALRLKRCSSCDTDRVMRHEVEDQKANSTAADSSEHIWIARTSEVIDAVNAQIFKKPLTGLRSS